ncbi:hypothetical protein V1512DRAFT_293312 [Lipomyces arxii]|uniref:uncharacterized protein n=1 Tax=Lipomyces arxii TaxID=56418 RepID=UPI0034CEDF27
MSLSNKCVRTQLSPDTTILSTSSMSDHVRCGPEGCIVQNEKVVVGTSIVGVQGVQGGRRRAVILGELQQLRAQFKGAVGMWFEFSTSRRHSRRAVEEMFVNRSASASASASATETTATNGRNEVSGMSSTNGTNGVSSVNGVNSTNGANRNANGKGVDGVSGNGDGDKDREQNSVNENESESEAESEEEWNEGYKYWKAQRRRWTVKSSERRRQTLSVGPESYGRVYNLLVNEGRRLKNPVNLSDATKILVSGWKQSGQWPPVNGPLDPLIGRKREIK